MTQFHENASGDFIMRIQTAAHDMHCDLPPETVQRFIERLYGSVPGATLSDRRPPELAAAAVSLLSLLHRRRPGQPAVRLYAPTTWDKEDSTIVEMVNDDMPHLVESVVGEIKAAGLSLRHLLHPILDVCRDHDGVLQGLSEEPAETGRAAAESVIYAEIEGHLTKTERDGLAVKLAAALDDVRAAECDRAAMIAHCRALAHGLTHDHGIPVPCPEGAFLGWLAEGNFSYLGAYTLMAEDGGAWSVAADSAQGICRAPTGSRVRLSEVLFGVATRQVSVVKTRTQSGPERDMPLDVVTVKRSSDGQEPLSIDVFLGLFTPAARAAALETVPMLNHTLTRVMERSGFRPSSHAGRFLRQVLDSYPRDELLRLDEDDILTATGRIVALGDTGRVVLSLHPIRAGELVSCLVHVPQDKFDVGLRQATRALMETSLAGRVIWQSAHVSTLPLARLHFLIEGHHLRMPDAAALESRIENLTRTWEERLLRAISEGFPGDDGAPLAYRYVNAFPGAYRQSHDVHTALHDLTRIERLADPDDLTVEACPHDADDDKLRLRIYNRGAPLPLSRRLSIMENLGLEVLTDQPYRIRCGAAFGDAWINDLEAHVATGEADRNAAALERLTEAFVHIWHNTAENDPLNRLILSAGLDYREVALLRAYGRYLRQIAPIGRRSVERILGDHPRPSALLVAMFHARFAPGCHDDHAATALRAEFLRALQENVPGAEEDRIFRRFDNLITATLRTNFFQNDAHGQAKPHISFKFDSAVVEGLPAPRPHREIFVCSPDLEAIHLRGGPVARGGIRWSDRPDDFRTEVLGLVKAQMVKNAVIVPVGAKGAFVIKRPVAGDAMRRHVVECYRTMIRGLLDLTDNIVAGRCVPPPDVVRHDGDDPYLVVAADKGTANFSDVANAIACDEYAFWLDDAFASGGSHGYDHKKMGITARGAWESVRCHFRRIGVAMNKAFTVVGVGDMSGDVFGNGMLMSKHIRLRAAFDHRHIFLDPAPDPARSFRERHRLFALSHSSWADYDPAELSAGGGVYPRTAKQLTLSPEAADMLGLDSRTAAPDTIIQAILATEVDLLWFGGIGTYVKASWQSHADVSDHVNDTIRVDASALRAKVVGEGANLAMTQAARVEYALAGGRINTDAVDNSAGVDTSDHEVNIKILLEAAIRDGTLATGQRDAVLATMTTDVAAMVLRDNVLQNCALATAERAARHSLQPFRRLLARLENEAGLSRRQEGLPSDSVLDERAAAAQGLTRPELAVLMAYAKNWLRRTVAQDGVLARVAVEEYFPTAIRDDFAAHVRKHPLIREIAATMLANCVVNHAGPTFVPDLMEQSGGSAAEVVGAYLTVRDHLLLGDIWHEVETVEPALPAATLDWLADNGHAFLRRVCASLADAPIDHDQIAMLGEAVALLRGQRRNAQASSSTTGANLHATSLRKAGLGADRIADIVHLDKFAQAIEMVRLMAATGCSAAVALQTQRGLDGLLRLDELRHRAWSETAPTWWQGRARTSLLDNLAEQQRRIGAAIAQEAQNDAQAQRRILARLQDENATTQLSELIAQSNAKCAGTLETLAIASRLLATLAARCCAQADAR